MAVTKPSAINMAVPEYAIDNVIGIHSGSFSVAAPTAIGLVTNASDSFSTGFGDTCLFQGVFSVDSGTTWNDFGAYKPNLTTPTQPVLQTVTCQGWITPTGSLVAYATNWYDLVHSTSSAYTVQYRVALLAKSDQGAITPLGTNESIYYWSKYNYQKVYLVGSFINSGSPTTITHNLGYVPKVRAWGTSSNSTPWTANSLLSYDWFGSSGFNITITTTSVTFDSISSYGTVNVYYRIYLDS